MPIKLAPHQLAFWRELLAPFPSSQLSTTKRGGKELTYIDKRSLTNRLDSILGPDGWYPEYEATARGYKCRLYLRVPMSAEGVEVFMAKEDGAGFEEMGAVNKTTNEFEYDVDNDEKSGYTNAFRRAAQDAWGIGRYLYGKGIPSFLDPNASAPAVTANAHPPTHPSAPPAELADKSAPPVDVRQQQPAPAGRQPAPAPPPAAADGQPYNNFKIPKPGKSVFAWTKEMEKIFETSLVDGLGKDGEEQGWGRQFNTWNEAQVNTICLKAIRFIRELPTYKGQYEHLFPGGVASASIPQTRGSGPNAPAPTPGVNVADLRKKLMVSMQALVTKQTGQPADNPSLKTMFSTIASSAKNEQGQTGEVPESLAKLTDAVWVANMIALVEKQIAESCGPSDEGDPTIPF